MSGKLDRRQQFSGLIHLCYIIGDRYCGPFCGVSRQQRLVKSLSPKQWNHATVCVAFQTHKEEPCHQKTEALTVASDHSLSRWRKKKKTKREYLKNQYSKPVNGFLHLCCLVKNVWERKTNSRQSCRDRGRMMENTKNEKKTEGPITW